MRRTYAENVHHAAYSARLDALSALRGASAEHGSAQLYAAAEKLRPVVIRYGEAPNAVRYRALADLAHIAGLLCEWRDAVMNAGAEADRFRAAAQARAIAWLGEYGADERCAILKVTAESVSEIAAVSAVAPFAEKLATIPLPIGVYAVPEHAVFRGAGSDDTQTKVAVPELSVAFVKFSIDGVSLAEVHSVSPGESHDIDIEVRISRWPKKATHLVIEPLTVEPVGTYRLPTFHFDAPTDEIGPFCFTDASRFVLSVPQHFGARPFEFVYAARFEPSSCEQPVDIVGQRVLTLEGIDPARTKLTGYTAIDRQLLALRNTMRLLPRMMQDELADALILASVLGNYCGQVVQDNLYREVVSEREFQRRIRAFLRADQRVGSELEEHASASGGYSDLSFRGIRLELKVEAEKRLALADCSKFAAQAADYAVGSGKHIGLLSVLDCSPKDQSPFPMEDGIGVFPMQEGSATPVYVITFLLQGNLPRPSDLSR